MNRRNFLTGLGAVVGGLAIEQAIPLGRVWSFPSKIIVPQRELEPEEIRGILRHLHSTMEYSGMFSQEWDRAFAEKFPAFAMSECPCAYDLKTVHEIASQHLDSLA